MKKRAGGVQNIFVTVNRRPLRLLAVQKPSGAHARFRIQLSFFYGALQCLHDGRKSNCTAKPAHALTRLSLQRELCSIILYWTRLNQTMPLSVVLREFKSIARERVDSLSVATGGFFTFITFITFYVLPPRTVVPGRP